ncbi:MAG: UpxY family transcription antiterminator [Muribaculaceae bacterium]
MESNSTQTPADAHECKNWYAIRVTYNRELLVKEELEGLKMEYFLPMQYCEVMRDERRIKVLKPSIHNLIFIRATKDEIIGYKENTLLPIRYIMNRENHRPIVVPDTQMKSFIAVAGTFDEQVIYLDANLATMKRGEKVRIMGGIFAGAEGEFVRIKGDRRVVVMIPGIAAVATAFIHPSLIEKLSE